MSIEHRSVVNHPQAAVWAWHARPGAIHRLVPPWQPMKVLAESESLADGRAVLQLPGGVRWISQHQPDRYREPRRFADHLVTDGPVTWPPRLIGWWHHTHEFHYAGPGKTRLRDRVDTSVPAAALRSTFVYRHRQVADDLAAHRRAAEHGVEPLVVAVSGASGLVGSALAAFLSTGGHRVIRLVRRPARSRDERMWDPANPAPDLLAGVDAVVHLAGESISGRFTDAHKRAIRDSRVEPTRRLAKVAADTEDGPTVFVSASAIGYYGSDCGEFELTETSPRGDGFLADVVDEWEAATAPAADAGLRTVVVRTGIVQSARGGTLRLLRPLFSAGLGGRLGSGRQWLSWIGIDDLVDIYHRALWDRQLDGAVNAVAPQAVTNRDYTRALAGVLRRPAVLPVPSFGPRLLLGAEGVRELAEASQRVVPGRLLAAGHRFRQPQLATALGHQLGHPMR